jgi:hypothetical protein
MLLLENSPQTHYHIQKTYNHTYTINSPSSGTHGLATGTARAAHGSGFHLSVFLFASIAESVTDL